MVTEWTEEEKDKTETLRKRCGDLFAKLGDEYPKHKIDGMLIRFLRARNHDLAKSTEFLRSHLEWRIENLPIVLDQDVRDELMKGKYGIAGYDLGGNPCICIHQQKMGPHTYDDIEIVKKSIIYALVWLCDNKVAPDGKFSVVYSRVNCVPENSDVDWVKAVAPLLQNHYPERLYKAYLAPAPWIMRGVWNVGLEYKKRRFLLQSFSSKLTLTVLASCFVRDSTDGQVFLRPEHQGQNRALVRSGRAH